MPARALLVGAADYGAGFVPLPAVRHDLELMRDALVSRGFSVRIADPASVANASVLDGMMRSFCRDAGTDLSGGRRSRPP